MVGTGVETITRKRLYAELVANPPRFLPTRLCLPSVGARPGVLCFRSWKVPQLR